MHEINGAARYLFLRRRRGAREELPNWPPEVKPLQVPENEVGAGVFLFPEEDGWRAVIVKTDAAVKGDAGGAFVLTRETTLGVLDEGRRASVSFGLAGVRVVKDGDAGPEYASHLMVRHLGGSSRVLVAPVAALVLGEYREYGDRAMAQLDLKLTPAELGALPEYLPDVVIDRFAARTLDGVILSVRARHELKPETIAGRVSLYGRAELTSFGEQAKAELASTPGVVEVVDHLLYDELLQQEVETALAGRGLTDVGVLCEHGLIMLRGSVADNASRHKAKDLALRVPGVRGAVNEIEIAAPIVNQR